MPEVEELEQDQDQKPPWEDYQKPAQTAEHGPWEDYQKPVSSPPSTPPPVQKSGGLGTAYRLAGKSLLNFGKNAAEQIIGDPATAEKPSTVSMLLGPGYDIAKGIVKAPIDLYKGLRQPGVLPKVEAVENYIYSPVVKAQHQIGTGDYSGAGGTLAGGAAPFLLPEAMKMGSESAEAGGSLPKGRTSPFAPDIPPGLSEEATSNLKEPLARKGVENIFRAAGPSRTDVGFRETVSAAAPDLAEVARKTPLKTKGGVINPDFRAREFVTNAQAHMDDIWNKERAPAMERHADAEGSLAPAKQSMLQSISKVDREKSPGMVKAIETEIEKMPDTEKLSELDARRHQLSDYLDKYYKATPEQRVALDSTNPKIEAKNAEYKAVLGEIDNVLEKNGEANARQFGKRYGNLGDIVNQIRLQVNPAEQARLVDQIKSIFFHRGAERMATGTLVNPSVGRQLNKGLTQLGKTSLFPKVAPPPEIPQGPQVRGFLPPAPHMMPPVDMPFEGRTGTPVVHPGGQPPASSPEFMMQNHPPRGQGGSTEAIPPIHPQEHTILEQQAGRKLSPQQAAQFRNGQHIENTNRKMATTGEGTRDEISNVREPNRQELAKKAEPSQAVIESAGAKFLGIQKVPKGDLVLFNDPKTNSTLALPATELTKEKVLKSMRESAEKFK